MVAAARMAHAPLVVAEYAPEALPLLAFDTHAPRGISAARIHRVADELRLDIIEMLTRAGSGHPGGSFSAVNIVATLFLDELRHRPHEPQWRGRDRFVLSKGHCVPALYAMLARCGYFPRDELWTLRTLGSRLQGHPANQLCPGVEASTGSLGQGLSVALGMALAARLDACAPELPARVVALLGDGECQEGQVWEAALSAVRHGADNLVAIIDANGGQIDGLVKDVLDLEPLVDKWRSFGWQALEIDGHSVAALQASLADARAATRHPTLIVARTLKGHGSSLLERDVVGWHGKTPSRSEATAIIAEICQRLGMAA